MSLCYAGIYGSRTFSQAHKSQWLNPDHFSVQNEVQSYANSY